MNYSQFVISIANLLVVPTNEPRFVIALPDIITDSEQRLYRELGFISTIVRDSSAALTASNRNFTLPVGTATTGPTGPFVVVDGINVISPAGTSNPDSGTRNQLTPVSKEFLDASWNSVTGSTVPAYFAMINQASIIVGPWPDDAYQMEVIGEQRPAPLSATNTTTFLSLYLPDLFMSASMVFGCAYQKNWGAMADDPKMALAWEAHTQVLLRSAQVEEARKRFTAEGWSSKEPAPLATPPRT